MALSCKSIILDIADNWGDGTYLGLRSLELKLSSVLQTIAAGDISATYGSQYSSTYAIDKIFITSLSKTGADSSGWVTGAGDNSNQRIICVFTNVENFDEVVINNYHSLGSYTNRGVENVKITISPDTITDTTYDAAVSNGTVIYDSTFDQHVASNVADDQVLVLDFAEVTQIANDTLGINDSGLNFFGMLQVATAEVVGIAEGYIHIVTMVRQINEVLGISEGIIRLGIMIRLMANDLKITETVYKNYGIFQYIVESIGITDISIHKRVSTRIANTTVGITEIMESIFAVVIRALKKFVGYSDEAFYHISEYKNKFYSKVTTFGKFFYKGGD